MTVPRATTTSGHFNEVACHGRAMAKARAMRDFAERHLADHDFDIDDLRAAFGASRATVYRAFAADGGLAKFLNERRIAGACRDLAKSSPARGRIGEISRRWGFAEPGRFNRLFRRRFGMSPSDVLLLGEIANDVPTVQPRPRLSRASSLDRLLRE